MKCVPLEILEARLEVISFNELIDSFERFMMSNKYARVVVYPSIGKATIWMANPVSPRAEAMAKSAVNLTGYMNFRDEKEKTLLEEYLVSCQEEMYHAADNLLHRVLKSQETRLSHYVGQYNHIICKERNNGIPHADIEFNFDSKKNKEVIRAVKAYCDGNCVPYYNFEMHTTMRDYAMLSSCHSRDAMWIYFQAKSDVSRALFGDIEEVLKPIGFRKHWGMPLFLSLHRM